MKIPEDLAQKDNIHEEETCWSWTIMITDLWNDEIIPSLECYLNFVE